MDIIGKIYLLIFICFVIFILIKTNINKQKRIDKKNIYKIVFIDLILLHTTIILKSNLEQFKHIIVILRLYLVIEVSLVFFSFVVMLWIISIYKNKLELIRNYHILLNAIPIISFFANFVITYQLNKFGNWFWFILLILYQGLLLGINEHMFIVKSNVKEHINLEQKNIFQSILNKEDLYKERKEFLKVFDKLLKHYKSSESVSICLSSPWGDGKTSFINTYVQEYENDFNGYIKINTMDLQDIDALFEYFFNSLKSILDQHDIYTGKSSKYNEYISTIAGALSGQNSVVKSVINVLTSKQIKGNYMEKRIEFEEWIRCHLDKKILIIVDDIERCETEKIKEFIVFIKEICTFKNCITIFLCDYEKLGKHTENMDKFINRKIDLPKVNYITIINSVKMIKPKYKIFDKINDLLIKEINEVIRNLKKITTEAHFEKIKEYGNKTPYKCSIDEVIENLNNPRTVNKIIDYINEIMENINDVSIDESYLSNCFAFKNITYTAILYVLYPIEYQYLFRNSLVKYNEIKIQNLEAKEVELSVEDVIVIKMFNVFWFSKINVHPDRTPIHEYSDFIETYVTKLSIVNTVRQNWQVYLEGKNSIMLQVEEFDNILTLLSYIRQSSLNIDKKQKYIIKIIEIIGDSIKNEDIKSIDIIELLSTKKDFFSHYPVELHFFEAFFNGLIKNQIITSESVHIYHGDVQKVEKSIFDLIVYYIAANNHHNQRAINLDSNVRPPSKDIIQFFNDITNKHLEKYTDKEKSNINNNLQILLGAYEKAIKESVDKLKEYNYLVYDDVKAYLSNGKAHIQEINYIIQIKEMILYSSSEKSIKILFKQIQKIIESANGDTVELYKKAREMFDKFDIEMKEGAKQDYKNLEKYFPMIDDLNNIIDYYYKNNPNTKISFGWRRITYRLEQLKSAAKNI